MRDRRPFPFLSIVASLGEGDLDKNESHSFTVPSGFTDCSQLARGLLTNVLESGGDTKGVTMKKRTMLILAAVAVAVMAVAVPAFAQSTDQAP